MDSANENSHYLLLMSFQTFMLFWYNFLFQAPKRTIYIILNKCDSLKICHRSSSWSNQIWHLQCRIKVLIYFWHLQWGVNNIKSAPYFIWEVQRRWRFNEQQLKFNLYDFIWMDYFMVFLWSFLELECVYVKTLNFLF